MTNSNHDHLLNNKLSFLLHAFLLPDFLLSFLPLPSLPNSLSFCFHRYRVPAMFPELCVVPNTVALGVQTDKDSDFTESLLWGKLGIHQVLKIMCQNGLKCLSVCLLLGKGVIWGLEKRDFSVELFTAY